MPKRRNASHPVRSRLRVPLVDHLHASSNKIVGKVVIVVFALSNQAAPTVIAPNAECFSRFGLVARCDESLNAILGHPAIGPLFARLNGQAGSTKEFDGGFDQLSINDGRQWR